jgi:hypothetical protein
VRKGGVDAPRTLVVHNIRADFANLFGRAGKVQVVVLDLEVFSEGQEDIEGDLVIFRIRLILLLDGEATKKERKSDREVERVYGGLVKNNCFVPAWSIVRSDAFLEGDVGEKIFTYQG